MKRKKIVLFGASTLGEIAYEKLKNKYKIIFYCDNDKKKDGTYKNNIEIITVERLKNIVKKNVKIVITSGYYKEIFQQLIKNNFNNIYLFENDKGHNIQRLFNRYSYKNLQFRSINNVNILKIKENLLRTIVEVSKFNKNNFLNYEDSLKQYCITLGKIEIIDDRYRIIGMNLSNGNEGTYIVGILYDSLKEIIYLPNYIMKSAQLSCLKKLIKLIIADREVYLHSEKIIGKVNPKYKDEIEKKNLVYQWERAIPGTQFMVEEKGFLRIIERYKFAERYINSNYVILEGACGFGYGAAYLSDKCKKMYATDISEENIEYAKNAYKGYKNIKWEVSDVCALPYKDEMFDLYTSFETMEHISIDNVEKYLYEAARVLKKNGKFIISTPNKEKRLNINNPFHIKEYTENEVELLLKKYFKEVSYYFENNYVFNNSYSLLKDCIMAVCTK